MSEHKQARIMKKSYSGMSTINKHGTEFTDYDVAKYVIQHLRLRDRFNVKKIVEASLMAFDVFLDEAKIVSINKNWKFFDQDAKFIWIEEDTAE